MVARPGQADPGQRPRAGLGPGQPGRVRRPGQATDQPVVRQGQLGEAVVARYMASAAAMAGLPERETVATINSAFRAAGVR